MVELPDLTCESSLLVPAVTNDALTSVEQDVAPNHNAAGTTTERQKNIGSPRERSKESMKHGTSALRAEGK